MLDSNWKKYKRKVRFTFEDGRTYEAYGDELLQIDVQRHLANNNADPLGVVCAGTINIQLNDIEKKFVKNNKNSPFYGLIKEGFKIEWFISLDDGEFVRRGVYYATDIKNITKDGGYYKAIINGADILQYIGNRPVNIVGIKRNLTVKEYLTRIFKSVGLTESQFNIADSLNKVIKYAYAFGNKLKDVLNNVARSYMCNIFVDGDGVIQVVDLLDIAKRTDKRMEFSGVVNTPEVTLGTDLLDTYNAVRLKYTNPTIIGNDTLLDIDNFEIPPGTGELSEFTFKDGKKADTIDYVSILPADPNMTISINNMRWTQNSIVLNVSNDSEQPVKARIVVKGNALNENEAVMERYIANIPEEKRKYIEIDARLIQSDEYAEQYCETILRYLSADISYLTLVAKGNPFLELGDIVGVKSDLMEFDGTCIVSSIKMSFGMSSSFSYTVLNTAALVDSPV